MTSHSDKTAEAAAAEAKKHQIALMFSGLVIVMLMSRTLTADHCGRTAWRGAYELGNCHLHLALHHHHAGVRQTLRPVRA